MRRVARTLLAALAASVAIAALALLILFRFFIPKDEKALPAPAYTIGVWEGKVAVFEGDDDFPMQVFEDAIDGLPAEQRQAVLDGIAVHNPDELYLILEDYTS